MITMKMMTSGTHLEMMRLTLKSLLSISIKKIKTNVSISYGIEFTKKLKEQLTSLLNLES